MADLACGHGQHVRHDPPWQLRPWVITPEGRAQFIGTSLGCVLCAAPSITMAPDSIATERLLIHRWRAEHAPALHEALETSIDHLKPWIPPRVATPASVSALETRLAGFSAEFDAGREWSYAVMRKETGALLGGVSLHPRGPDGRVPFTDADRIEIGYWLRAGATGKGYASEAARGVLDVATSLAGMTCVEIRCNVHNAPSAAIPRRLGFRVAEAHVTPGTIPNDEASAMMTWELPLDPGMT